MITDAKKIKIKEMLRPNIVACTGKDWSDSEYDEYFITEYTEPKIIEIDDDNFFTYKVGAYIWLQDFVSDNKKKAKSLLDKIIIIQNENELDVKCQVQISNIRIINILVKSGFKIIDLMGYNYIIELRYKHGR